MISKVRVKDMKEGMFVTNGTVLMEVLDNRFPPKIHVRVRPSGDGYTTELRANPASEYYLVPDKLATWSCLADSIDPICDWIEDHD